MESGVLYRTRQKDRETHFAQLDKVQVTRIAEGGITSRKRTPLLIIDDFGLEPIDASNGRTLLEITEDRYQQGAMIITSQIPVESWYELFGESTVADAILDRLVHNAHRVNLYGESMRKKTNKI